MTSLAADVKWSVILDILDKSELGLGVVIEARQVGFMLVVNFKKKNENSDEVQVNVYFEQQEITHATCSKCTDKVLCTHILCAIDAAFRSGCK